MRAYTRDIGHYIGRTLILTMLEEGAFNRLQSAHYNAERALPADRNILYRIARAMRAVERKAVESVLEKCFRQTEDGYVYRDVMEDVALHREEQFKAEARRNKRLASQKPSCKTDATAYANAMQNGCEPTCERNANHKPITNIHKPVNPTPNLSPEPRQAGSPPDSSGVGGVRFEKGKSWRADWPGLAQ